MWILSWGEKPIDLDLHIKFKTSPTETCDVSYAQTYCGDTEYIQENS